MAKQKKHEEEEHENHERWLVSYADMVTLLMCVFIVLFAMATVDARKLAALKESFSGTPDPSAHILQGSESVMDGGALQQLDTNSSGAEVKLDTPKSVETNSAASKALKNQTETAKAKQKEQDNLEQAKQEIQAALEQKGMGNLVQFQRNEKGLIVTIVTDKVVFDSGKAEIKGDGKSILDALAPSLQHLPNPVTVEGHTDNVPIASAQYPTNWELSTARATSVLRYIVEGDHFPSDRISAAGYADTHPIVPNDTADNRAKNRRVEILVRAVAGTPDDTTPVVDQKTSSTGSDLSAELPTLPEKPTIDLPKVSAATTEEHH